MFPLLGLPGQHGAHPAAGQTGARGCQVGSHTPKFILSFFSPKLLMGFDILLPSPNQAGSGLCEDLHAVSTGENIKALEKDLTKKICL